MDTTWKRLIGIIERNPDFMKSIVDKQWEAEHGSIEEYNKTQGARND